MCSYGKNSAGNVQTNNASNFNPNCFMDKYRPFLIYITLRCCVGVRHHSVSTDKLSWGRSSANLICQHELFPNVPTLVTLPVVASAFSWPLEVGQNPRPMMTTLLIEICTVLYGVLFTFLPSLVNSLNIVNAVTN